MSRIELAQNLAAGLSGWLQLNVVQKLGDFPGEDTARFLTAQIVNAQGRYLPATSQLPQNWGTTKKRVDVALKARSQGATTWYGAIEIKWPGASFDVDQTRLQIVQDAMRLTFISTSVLNANFLVIGGSADSIKLLFDRSHPRKVEKNERRISFGRLLSRDLNQPKGGLTHKEWFRHFPNAGGRLPEPIFGNFNGKLKAQLLARSPAVIGKETAGHVYVWQCNKTRGAAQPTR